MQLTEDLPVVLCADPSMALLTSRGSGSMGERLHGGGCFYLSCPLVFPRVLTSTGGRECVFYLLRGLSGPLVASVFLLASDSIFLTTVAFAP